MRELTMDEIEEVSGGNPLVPLFAGVGAVLFYAAVGGMITYYSIY